MMLDDHDQPSAPPEDPAAQAAEDAPLSPALERFQSCRWRSDPDQGRFCTHRDVLPLAGRDGFHAEAWCPECTFFKVRRTPRKPARAQGY